MSRPKYKSLYLNEKKRRLREQKMRTTYLVIILLFLFALLAVILLGVENPLVSPLPDGYIRAYEVEKEVPVKQETLDTFVADAVTEFMGHLSSTHQSEAKALIHCLLHRESRHASSQSCGDGGLACGPLQFHQATWVRMRRQMGEEIGSRLDLKESIRTTAWAIANGRAGEWGPVYRSLRGSDYATCQVPSWYDRAR